MGLHYLFKEGIVLVKSVEGEDTFLFKSKSLELNKVRLEDELKNIEKVYKSYSCKCGGSVMKEVQPILFYYEDYEFRIKIESCKFLTCYKCERKYIEKDILNRVLTTIDDVNWLTRNYESVQITFVNDEGGTLIAPTEYREIDLNRVKYKQVHFLYDKEIGLGIDFDDSYFGIPVFFNKDVLFKYRISPKYRLKFKDECSGVIKKKLEVLYKELLNRSEKIEFLKRKVLSYFPNLIYESTYFKNRFDEEFYSIISKHGNPLEMDMKGINRFLIEVNWSFAEYNPFNMSAGSMMDIFKEIYTQKDSLYEYTIPFYFHENAVVFKLNDIVRLPIKEQYYMKSENIKPLTGDKIYFNDDILNFRKSVKISVRGPNGKKFTPPQLEIGIPPELEIIYTIIEINKEIQEKFGFDLIKLTDNINTLSQELQEPLVWDKLNIQSSIINLNNQLIDSINTKEIRKQLLNTFGVDDKDLKSEDGRRFGSRILFQIFLEKLLNISRDETFALERLYRLRTELFAHGGKSNKEVYETFVKLCEEWSFDKKDISYENNYKQLVSELSYVYKYILFKLKLKNIDVKNGYSEYDCNTAKTYGELNIYEVVNHYLLELESINQDAFFKQNKRG